MSRLCPSDLLACTAILCWNNLNFSYSFLNVTDCSPNSMEIFQDRILLPNNVNLTLNNSKSFVNGFICSNCTRRNFVRLSSINRSQCQQSSIRIQLNSFCSKFLSNRNEENHCHCSTSKDPIRRIHQWNQVTIPSGKSNLNPRKSQDISGSLSSSIFIFSGLLLVIVLLGGFIGLVSFYIQSKRRKK